MWNVPWYQIHHPQNHKWPEGYQLYGSIKTGYKLYFEGNLCVPTGLGYKIVAAQHMISGHLGANKLVTELQTLYNFGHEPPVRELAGKIKSMCTICQACDPPSWTLKGPLHMTSVLSRALKSSCVDVFQLPTTTWYEENMIVS